MGCSSGWMRCGLSGLNRVGEYLAPLGLRLLLAYEFWVAGVEKFRGENWFADIQEKFPFPFSAIPTELSWQMATWFEMIGALALVVGLATRFFSVSLAVLTIVAIAAVHWPAQWSTLAELWQGFVVTDNGQGNFKLPLIYLVMFLPLILSGPGKLSLDHAIFKRFTK